MGARSWPHPRGRTSCKPSRLEIPLPVLCSTKPACRSDAGPVARTAGGGVFIVGEVMRIIGFGANWDRGSHLPPSSSEHSRDVRRCSCSTAAECGPGSAALARWPRPDFRRSIRPWPVPRLRAHTGCSSRIPALQSHTELHRRRTLLHTVPLGRRRRQVLQGRCCYGGTHTVSVPGYMLCKFMIYLESLFFSFLYFCYLVDKNFIRAGQV